MRFARTLIAAAVALSAAGAALADVNVGVVLSLTGPCLLYTSDAADE